MLSYHLTILSRIELQGFTMKFRLHTLRLKEKEREITTCSALVYLYDKHLLEPNQLQQKCLKWQDFHQTYHHLQCFFQSIRIWIWWWCFHFNIMTSQSHGNNHIWNRYAGVFVNIYCRSVFAFLTGRAANIFSLHKVHTHLFKAVQWDTNR